MARRGRVNSPSFLTCGVRSTQQFIIDRVTMMTEMAPFSQNRGTENISLIVFIANFGSAKSSDIKRGRNEENSLRAFNLRWGSNSRNNSSAGPPPRKMAIIRCIIARYYVIQNAFSMAKAINLKPFKCFLPGSYSKRYLILFEEKLDTRPMSNTAVKTKDATFSRHLSLHRFVCLFLAEVNFSFVSQKCSFKECVWQTRSHVCCSRVKERRKRMRSIVMKLVAPDPTCLKLETRRNFCLGIQRQDN
jgi:hypothetical protein